MKGSAIHKRLTLLHLPCLCPCISSFLPPLLWMKADWDWKQENGPNDKGIVKIGKGQSVCVGRAQRRKVRLRNNEDKGEKEINSVEREGIQKKKERTGSPAEGMQGKCSVNHEFLFRTSQRKKLRRNSQRSSWTSLRLSWSTVKSILAFKDVDLKGNKSNRQHGIWNEKYFGFLFCRIPFSPHP